MAPVIATGGHDWIVKKRLGMEPIGAASGRSFPAAAVDEAVDKAVDFAQ